MSESPQLSFAGSTGPRPWDARLARRLVTPLKDSWVTPNHLTTVRLLVGLAAAWAFMHGTYGWSNLAALLLSLSNFLDHTDGELARISGKTSRIGHLYDLGTDAAVTILLFVAIGAGLGTDIAVVTGLNMALRAGGVLGAHRGAGGQSRLRDRVDFPAAHAHRGAGGQSRHPPEPQWAGFETEDVLYLLWRPRSPRNCVAAVAASAGGEPQLSAGPQAGRQRQPPHHRSAGAVHRRTLSLAGADRLAGAAGGRALAGVARRGSARLCAVFLHAARRPHRLALRHVLLRRPSLYAAARRDRRVLLPARLRVAHARAGRGRGPGLAADSPGGLVFFDGDKLRHRITPLGEGECACR
jgi:hypothetical protein